MSNCDKEKRNCEIFSMALSGKTNVEIGSTYNLTSERVRQIVAKAIRYAIRRISQADKETFPAMFQESMFFCDDEFVYYLENVSLRHMQKDPDFWLKRYVEKRWLFTAIRPCKPRKAPLIRGSSEDRLTNLDLTIRSLNNLADAGIGSVTELITKTEEELYELSTMFGRKSINEIHDALAEIGLELRRSVK